MTKRLETKDSKSSYKKEQTERLNRDADIIDLAASEEPVRHMQGFKTVLEALKLEDFPMTKVDVDYAVGDIDVEDGHGGFVPVYELTEKFHIVEFSSPDQVIHELKIARRGFKKSSAA